METARTCSQVSRSIIRPISSWERTTYRKSIMFEVDNLSHPPFHICDNGEHFTAAKRFFWIGVMYD